MWLTWLAQCLRSRFATLGARQQPTFFKQEKEVIVSPIALLKTVSRKKNLAFSHIMENSKDRFTFTEKGGQTRMPVKKQSHESRNNVILVHVSCKAKNAHSRVTKKYRGPQVILSYVEYCTKDLICLRCIASLHTAPTYHLNYVSPYTKYLPICIESAVHANAHGTQHGVVEVSCVHCTFAWIYSCRPTAKHT